MTKEDLESRKDLTWDEEGVVAAQIRLSPRRSPKKFLRTGIVTCSEEELRLIDDTLRTEERSQLTMSLIKSYGLMDRLHSIPLIPGKTFNLTF